MITVEHFVRLLDENVEVWRPVTAKRITSDHFRIVDQPYDPGTERWEFVPGDEVKCEVIKSDDEDFLAATKRLRGARHGRTWANDPTNWPTKQ